MPQDPCMKILNTDTSIVITSIAGPANPVLQDYSAKSLLHDVRFIVVGDTMSPDDFYIDGCNFYSLSRQRNLGYTLIDKLPLKHYARKNIGYLEAITFGSRIIIETDDDNLALSGFWNYRDAHVEAASFEETGWFNVYNRFTNTNVWPRGFPLTCITRPLIIACQEVKQHFCPIQQGLVKGNPDVDAIYRLTQSTDVTFSPSVQVVLGRNCWCPFNSQNTTWFVEAFPLLYLPSYCSFRLTDIWVTACLLT